MLGMYIAIYKPVVFNGQISIRLSVVVALAYDHRSIEGREAVMFLG